VDVLNELLGTAAIVFVCARDARYQPAMLAEHFR
jgi:hypothetical protein